MYQLENFFTEGVQKSKFVKAFRIPKRIIENNLQSNYVYRKKYGGFGIVFLYTHHVIKLIISPNLTNVGRYIKPELEGITRVKSNPHFLSCHVLNDELLTEHRFKITSFKNIFYYDGRYFAMVLMNRYLGDIYRPTADNVFSNSDKQAIIRFVVKMALTLLDEDLLYGDLKLEQIMYKKNKRGRFSFKFGDFGSLATLNFSKVTPTYAPVKFMRKNNLTTIQVFLFSLANLWFDLYRDQYDEDRFYLSYDKITYDDTFNYNAKKHLDKISIDKNYIHEQKKIVLRWLTCDLKSLFVDIETNKKDLKIELLSFLSVNRHYYYTDCNKPKTSPFTSADTFV